MAMTRRRKACHCCCPVHGCFPEAHGFLVLFRPGGRRGGAANEVLQLDPNPWKRGPRVASHAHAAGVIKEFRALGYATMVVRYAPEDE